MSDTYINLPVLGVTSINNTNGALTLVAASGINVSVLNSIFTIGNTGVLGLGTPNGLTLSSQLLSLTLASATTTGALSASDWNTFNNKIDASRFNYISNPYAETDVNDWNLYNNSGRTVAAAVTEQDLTYTSVAPGNAGNGINVKYIFHASQSYLTPLVTVVSPTLITLAWYNGPTLANNPTATQLKAAWDAVPGAVAIATVAITGTASDRQYITGSHFLADGGDTAPINGAGGAVSGVTLTRSMVSPIVGTASFDLGKDATSRQGMGVSTDFIINSLDRGQPLQINIAYSGSTGMVLGSSSDIRIFAYDIINNIMLPVTPLKTIVGPVNTIKTFVGQFTTSANSVSYRLILHIATANAVAWDLFFDNVVVNDILNATAATQVPSLVLQSQPISGAVTDHMAVAWVDGATQWVPATSSYNGDYWSMLGFATNILAGTADIYIRGYMDGFSFGPFLGYNQYIDPASAGSLTPLPSPFTDTYVIMGKAISSFAINIQPYKGYDLVPTKGGLLTNAGLNNGAGDEVLAVGGNGNVLTANSAVAKGINWAPAVVAAAPFAYTTATRTLTIATSTNSVAGVLSAADHTTYSGYAATIALKAPIATPVFTGDVTSSTGNVLVSTIGKGLQIKTGVGAKIGQAALVGGTATVANPSITASSRIFLTSQADGGVPGFVRVTAKTNATSFVITSSNALDTSTIAWTIIESVP